MARVETGFSAPINPQGDRKDNSPIAGGTVFGSTGMFGGTSEFRVSPPGQNLRLPEPVQTDMGFFREWVAESAHSPSDGGIGN